MNKEVFGRTYPPPIVAKYLEKVLPATESGPTAFSYIGPKIETLVRAIGVQHFVVLAVPESRQIAEFKSSNGSEAFNQAVMMAEDRGLPWMVSGYSDAFEPTTGRRWDYHFVPMSANEEPEFHRKQGCET